jgi:hypothetical protein
MKLEINGYRFAAGASAPKSIKARILLIARERGIPDADVKRAVKASDRRGDYLIDFALAHGINLDWLLLGDIRGLRWMKRLTLAVC